MITKANATKLAAWLYVHEPALFRKILVTTQKLQRSPFGRLGYFGDDSAIAADDTLSEVTPDVSYMSDATVNAPDVTVDSASIDVPIDSNVTDSIAAAPIVDASVSDASQSSGSFWDSIGSSISGAAGAVGKVASGLLSPQTLAAAGTATAAYFNSQARTAQTQQQQALVNAQLARVRSGYSPAPVTYVRNPTTGQLTPVYASNSGYTPVTSSLYNRLTAPAGMSISPLTIGAVLGGGILIALLLAR